MYESVQNSMHTLVSRETYLALDVLIDIVYVQQKKNWSEHGPLRHEVECAPSTTTSWEQSCKNDFSQFNKMPHIP